MALRVIQWKNVRSGSHVSCYFTGNSPHTAIMTIFKTCLEDDFTSYQRIWSHQMAQTTLIADLFDTVS